MSRLERADRIRSMHALSRSALALVLVLAAASCSTESSTVVDVDRVEATAEVSADSGDEGASSDEATTIEAAPEPTAAPAPRPATPAPTVETEPATPADVDDFVGPFDLLVVGDCWNDVGNLVEGDIDQGDDVADGTARSIPSEPVSCQGEHEHEVFARAEAPYESDSDYPDNDVLVAELFADVCDPATIDFAGNDWNALPIQTWAFYPSEADWERGDRTVLCTVGSSLPEVNALKVGTAAAGSLLSDEAIVARSTIAGQRDWFLSFQGSPLYPLTAGQFQLQNTSPQVLQTGFLFAAPLQGETDSGSQAYFFDFDDPETLSAVDTGDLDGWDIMSPQLVVREPSTVFAARETDADDWDIYRSSQDTGAVLLTDNPGDDRWPTLLPDESGIVYAANGSIWVMNLDGSDQRQITDDDGTDFEVAVSPDGTQIVFASDRSGNDDIWIANIDGSELRNLTDHPSADAWPFFSADGSLIYWQTDRLGVNSVIMLMTAGGEDHSYFSFEFATNAAIMPPAAAERLAESIAPIGSEEPDYDVIEGEVDGFGVYTHPSERVNVALPVGWQVATVESDLVAEFVASPSIETFAETWAIDGLRVSLIEGTQDDFEAAIQASEAQTCDGGERVDDESASPDGQALALVTVEFTCGDATAWIVAVWNLETSVGLLLEAQFDSDPSQAADEELFVSISQNINWG